MAHGSLFPACVKVNYLTAHAPHVMTIPINEVVEPTLPFDEIEAYDWNGVPTFIATKIEAYVTLLADRFKATTNFVSGQVFTMDSPTAPLIPRASFPLDVPGTNAGTGWSKATEETLMWRCDDASLFKIVLLDVHSSNDFDRKISLGDLNLTDLDEMLRDDEGIIRSRLNSQPSTFLGRTCTLNEKLRRSYRMA
jgi:hypothetical protein